MGAIPPGEFAIQTNIIDKAMFPEKQIFAIRTYVAGCLIGGGIDRRIQVPGFSPGTVDVSVSDVIIIPAASAGSVELEYHVALVRRDVGVIPAYAF